MAAPDEALPPPPPVPSTLDDPGLAILHDMDESHGAPEDLDPLQLDALRALFEREDGLGLYCFAYYICGATELYPPLHLEVCEFLSRWGYLELANGSQVRRPPRESDTVTNSWRRLHLCIPRDHFKTTLATRANALWVVTRDPEATVGIFHANEAKSKTWIGATKQVIQSSKLYHLIWPHVLPPGVHFKDRAAGKSIPRTWKWGDTGILLNRNSHMVAELTIEPFGIGGATAGKHFTHSIKDDLVDDKAARSEATMQEAIDWVNYSRALERPAENGCELVCYTRWAYYDVYRHMLDKWPGDYRVYLRHILEDPATGAPDVVNGKAIFPDRISTTKAKEMYESDHYSFMSQYMNIPMAGQTTSFQHSWVRHGTLNLDVAEPYFTIDPSDYSPNIMHADLQGTEERAPNLIPLHWMNKAILLDPAPSKASDKRSEPRARNGLVVVGKDAWGRNFHLDSRPSQDDPVQVLYHLLELANTYSTYRVGIEEVCFSAIYAPLWNRILYHEHPDVHFDWVPLNPKGMDKDTRIFSMAPSLREGFWYFDRERSGYTLQELVEFPYGQTRDLIDAMSYTDKVLGRPETTYEATYSRYWARRVDNERSPITGY